MNKYVFKRYELKYILTPEKYKILLDEINKYLSVDQYGEVTIQSLYYDTSSNRIVRNSMERPDYKEKLRLRSYGLASNNTPVFLELKKKAMDIVYKRRIEIMERDVQPFINCGKSNPTQLEKEIIYFVNYYQSLKPNMLLLYDRTAYTSDDSDLRITFDKNVRYRTTDLNLCTSLEGNALFPNGEILMEVKTSLGFPIWLVKLLNKNRIYKGRFSKYAAAYEAELQNKKLKKLEEEVYV